jgi:hypothetical protein
MPTRKTTSTCRGTDALEPANLADIIAVANASEKKLFVEELR